MVQILGEFSEFSTGAFLLPDFLVTELLLVVVIEEASDVFVLVRDVGQVLFASVEVVLILATVVPTVAIHRRFRKTIR